jgi:pyruvate-ferredoxin/flavodoxin oxidoreductase
VTTALAAPGAGAPVPASLPRQAPPVVVAASAAPAVAPAAPAVAPAAPAAPAPAPATAVAVAQDEDAMVMEPYVESALCTSCHECTNINNKLFDYNADKQSYVKDPRAGSFQQLVRAAELCPVHAIHPGTPLNPKEKDLDKWVARADALN